ncbi:GNAT family N-acetyltransferase [Desulfovibrio aminophilus]|uniref:GNAT family N-acetyltransferase n=1 Tax=Desulfovibrio aminophilus TaxID=81425 RepID=UPI003391CD04
MMDIRIEPFAPEHQDGVVDVILTIQRKEFGLPITLEDQPDLLDIPGVYRRDKGNFWVALFGGEVVGTLALLDIGSHQGALRKMFVRADRRGPVPGLAARLLAALLDWGRGNGFRDIFLGTTSRYLAAHRFYEKNGFVRVDREALPPAFPIMQVDTIFYHLGLEG